MQRSPWPGSGSGARECRANGPALRRSAGGWTALRQAQVKLRVGVVFANRADLAERSRKPLCRQERS